MTCNESKEEEEEEEGFHVRLVEETFVWYDPVRELHGGDGGFVIVSG